MKSKISRRLFVKKSSAFAGGVSILPALGTFVSGYSHGKPLSDKELIENFKNPPVTARPFVRWWWNGDKLSKQEILRELDLMKGAGIGGFEINSIKFPNPITDSLNIPSLEWLSEEWIKMVKVAVEGAKERGMVADIIVGSGWPFGGRFLKDDEQTQILSLGTRNIRGPVTLKFTEKELMDDVKLHLHSPNDKILKKLKYVRLVPAEMNEFDPGIDLSDDVKNGALSFDVSAGDFVLYYLVLQTGFQAVINGAPGSDGPVLNHYNKPAVQRYLNRMSDALKPRIGTLGNSFRAMFCDSLELEGANWCDDMPEEFEKRRGYSLLPFLPFVLFKTGHMGDTVDEQYGARLSQSILEKIKHVRYDFCITRIELFGERFVDTFQEWCEANEVKSRMQAYGRGYHLLEASMKIDIPECETWLWKGIETPDNRAFSVVNKFVASGARLSGKKIVSCEETTNTTMVFNATLQMVKIAGDQSNLSGVTHSILHGFNYSPKEAKFPGWVRYGTFYNERNPWWPFLRKWTDYKARLSTVFQNSEPRANIAILHPLDDIWMQFDMQRQPFPKTAYPNYQFKLWEAIHQNGNSCDYISENVICKSKFNNGQISYNNRKYHTIILMEVDTIRPDTAAALKKFARSGGRLIFIGKAPSQSPGLLNYEGNDKVVKETIADILKYCPEECSIVPSPAEDLIGWFKQVQKKYNLVSDVEINNPNIDVSQISFKNADKDIFFFTNTSMEKEHTFQAKFNTAKKTPWKWDPETGERSVYPYAELKNELEISLQPAGSLLLVFDPQISAKPAAVAKVSYKSPFELTGAWDVLLNHVSGAKKEITFDKLVDLKDVNDLRSFAGDIIYRKVVKISSENSYNFLDLGKVLGVSQLNINGKELGTKWYGNHIYSLAETLKQGDNTVEIKVFTVPGNYCKSLTDNEIAQRWTREQDFQSVGLIGPVKLLKEKKK